MISVFLATQTESSFNTVNDKVLTDVSIKFCYFHRVCISIIFKVCLGQASISNVHYYHRHNQGWQGGRVPQTNSSISCFVLWEAVSQTKCCCLLKVKIFWPLPKFWAGLLLVTTRTE